jgi:hypothetical protein
MPTIQEIIKDKLKENRPSLSDSSLKTYISILKNLYKKVYGSDEFLLNNFKNQDKFIKYLDGVESSKRKSYLSALVVICNDECEKYSRLMMNDSQEHSQEQKSQIKNEKQETNWIEQDELHNIMNNLEIEANKIFKSKNPNVDDLQKAQNFILLCLVSGRYLNFVRRSLDWAEMKITEPIEDDNSNNYLKINKRKPWEFIFRRYKTARFTGEEIIQVPNELKKILTKWLKLLKQVCPNSEYLLIDKNCNKLSSVKITQRLNTIFGKKASINILRHSFITEKYKNMPSLEELEENAKNNGHSLREELEYIRK